MNNQEQAIWAQGLKGDPNPVGSEGIQGPIGEQTQKKMSKKSFQKNTKTEQTEISEKKAVIKTTDSCSDHFQLRTKHFDFTRAEMLFVRKMIHRKYPVSMHGFVEHIRELMADIQQHTKNKQYYEAELVYNNDGSRYRVSEAMYTQLTEEQQVNGILSPSVVAIEPMSREQRTAIRNNQISGIPNGVENVMNLLSSVIDGTSSFATAKSASLDMWFKDLSQKLMDFFEKVKKDAVVFAFNLSVADGNPKIYLDVGHAQSQSHSLTLAFELVFE